MGHQWIDKSALSGGPGGAIQSGLRELERFPADWRPGTYPGMLGPMPAFLVVPAGLAERAYFPIRHAGRKS